ncbi:MAG: NAD(P)/FAD-dependent oxidoreductase [Acidobacteriota bacterium]
MKQDVIVIGGGAAGLLCAIEAGKRGRSVVVLEREDRIGKKISISGGGRCNFTNLNTDPINYLSANPDFAKSALARFTPSDFIALVEKHGIGYHEKKLGQLFCNEGSSQIIRMLLKECQDAGVKIVANCTTRRVSKAGSFTVDTDRGVFDADSLVIASGGLSIPKIGATDFAYTMAAQFGLQTVPTRCGLVPLLWNGGAGGHFGMLSGVSLDALVRCGRTEFRENILFTHRGLSGPAILQISSYWREGDDMTIDLLPDTDVDAQLAANQAGKIELATLLARHLPRRLALKWCELYVPSKPMNQYAR